MKVMIIGNSAGSILGFRLPLILDIVKSGHSVFAVANNFKEDDVTFLKQIGVVPLSFELDASGLNPFKEIKTILQLYNLMKVYKPDLVFSYFTKPVIYSSIVAKLIGITTIVGMIEGLGITYTMQPSGINLKQKIIMKIQSFLYYVSSYCIDELIVLNYDDEYFFKNNFNFKSINNIGGIGVDLEEFKFSELTVDPFNFLFIGRLLKEKGILYFLEASRRIKEKYPDITFTVLGSLDENNTNSISKNTLNEYIDDNIIIYPGLVKDVKKYIFNSTVFVLPSYYREGLPRSTQEALAMGRPIITTNSPGCSETVLENINGKLIDIHSSNSLYNAMEYMILNKYKLSAMGKESRILAEKKYDMKKINQRILNILNLNGVFNEKN